MGNLLLPMKKESSKKNLKALLASTSSSNQKPFLFPAHIIYLIHSAVKDKYQQKQLSLISKQWKHCLLLTTSSLRLVKPFPHDLTDKLSRCQRIISLDLEASVLGTADVQKIIRRCQQLKELKLYAIVSFSLFDTCQSLQELWLKRASDFTLSCLLEACPNVSKLHLDSPYLSLTGAGLIASSASVTEVSISLPSCKVLPSNHPVFSKVKSLDVSLQNHDFKCSNQHCGLVCQSLTNLQSLQIDWRGSVDDHRYLMKDVNSFSQIRHMSLMGLNNVEEVQFNTLFDSLRFLQGLHVQRMQLSNVNLRHLAKKCRFLMELGLSECFQLTSEGYREISNLIYLASLDICRCASPSDEVVQLIQHHCSYLQHLRVYY